MSQTTARPPAVPAARARTRGVDLLRVIGIVGIIAGHTWSSEEWVRAWLFTWSPLFFVISGYLWTPGRSSTDELHRRSRTLLVPYVAWLGVVSAIWLGFGLIRGERNFGLSLARDVVLGGWYVGSPYSAFWFVTALLVATVLMRWLQNRSPLLPWLAGLAGVVWCIVHPVSITHVPEAAGLALPAVLFVCCGALLKRWRESISRPLSAGLCLLIPGFLLGGSGWFLPFDMKNGSLGTPVVGVLIAVAITWGLILTCTSFEHHISARVGRLITAGAEAGMPMILGHSLVLAVARDLGVGSLIGLFLLALCIPLAAALIIRATPARQVLM